MKDKFVQNIRKRCCAVAALAALFCGTCLAGQALVSIEEGWVRAVPPSSADSVAYMTLVNSSERPLHLTAASSPAADIVMPMVTLKKTLRGQEVMGMERVDELVIPAHGRLALAPNGAHLMLMGLKEHPRPGTKIKLTLHFEPGGTELVTELSVALIKP